LRGTRHWVGRTWQRGLSGSAFARRAAWLLFSATVLSGGLLNGAARAATPSNASSHSKLYAPAGPSGGSTLPGSDSTTTVLEASPSTPVTNEVVSLAATVSSAIGAPYPSGEVAFENGGVTIGGCGGIPVDGSGLSVTAVCSTSFGASTAELTAIFTPVGGSYLTGSVSPTDSLTVSPQSSSTNLDASSRVIVGIGTIFTATVTTPSAGPLEPAGAVEFYDGDQPIGSCLSQPLMGGAATCMVTYRTAGAHAITARYVGDANFTGSSSSIAAVSVTPTAAGAPGTITSTMEWTFDYRPSYTIIRALVVNGVPTGATVLVKCHGRGCPFAGRAIGPANDKRCGPEARRICSANGTVVLTPGFDKHHLSAGAAITVAIVRPNWTGKYYAFTMRARQGPNIRISCVAPGGTLPGAGC